MNRDELTERPVASIREIADATGLDPEAVADVVYGGSYMMDDKEKVEDFLGMEMHEVQVYVGKK